MNRMVIKVVNVSVTIFTQEKSTSCARKTEKCLFRRMSIHYNKNVQIKYYNIHHILLQ